ncbi:MAG: hypothetical protein M1814_005795 [Vezdaea aestivalis]|nr:MAG: hypothetical protein M1814_005795 [Vezdaea aestivalis]
MSSDRAWDQSRFVLPTNHRLFDFKSLTQYHDSANPSNVPTAPGGVSLKTNVNRIKTKRVVEAKSYSYEGDDWGGDDYADDDDPEDDPLPPVPTSRATGLRQHGDSSVNRSQPDEVRKPYGPPGDAVPQVASVGSRTASHPLLGGRPRKNSFDKGDDRRIMSGNQALPPLSTQSQPPKTFSQIGVSPGGMVSSPQTVAPPTGAVPPPPMHPAQAHPPSTSHQSSPNDSPSRRDPFPVMKTSAPSTATENPSAVSFPPRKSSRSQQDLPVPPASVLSSAPTAKAIPGVKGGEPTALPFVRPADIYKRVEMEKQKERQSSESSRPVMDPSLSSSATISPPTLANTSRVGYPIEEAEGRRQAHTLKAVPEGKSGYGVDGGRQSPVAASHNSAYTGQPIPEAFSASPMSNLPPGTKGVNKDTGPKLPSLSRVSGFGDDFFNTGLSSATEKPRGMTPDEPQTTPKAETNPLQHQPSQGFRSIVHQAFDKNDDLKSASDTPSSFGGSQRSNASSGVRRADTSSTSGISPIISRNPSAAHGSSKLKEGAELSAAPAIAEEPSGLGVTGQAVGGKALQSQVSGHDSAVPVLRPGHRRDMNTPSPNNSPARSPAVESSEPLVAPQGAEIAATTPTDSRPVGSDESLPYKRERSSTNRGQGLDYSLREADLASAAASQPRDQISGINTAEREAQASFLESRGPPVDLAATNTKAPARADSPSKPTVRELAGQSNSKDDSRRGSEDSVPKGESPTKSAPSNAAFGAPRPLAEREGSFRPPMPGGWTSYATTTESVSARGNTDGASTPTAMSGSNLESSMMPPPFPSNKNRDGYLLSAPKLPMQRLQSTDSGVTMTSQMEPNPYSDTSIDPRIDDSQAQQLTAARGGNSENNAGAVAVAGTAGGAAVVGAAALASQSRQAQAAPESSVPPTPPPKNTPPAATVLAGESSYFKDSITNNPPGSKLPPIRSEAGPSLSTETSPQDQESDRLRKEIVKSLTPVHTNDSVSSIPIESPPQRTTSDSSRIAGKSRESTFLPSEYDSYWASTDTPSLPSAQGTSPLTDMGAATSAPIAPAPLSPSGPRQSLPQSAENQTTSINQSTTTTESRPGLLPNRFSWEDSVPTQSNQPSAKAPTAPPAHAHSQSGADGMIPVTEDYQEGYKSGSIKNPGPMDPQGLEVVPMSEPEPVNPASSTEAEGHSREMAEGKTEFGSYLDQSFETPHPVDATLYTPQAPAFDEKSQFSPSGEEGKQTLAGGSHDEGRPPAVPPKIPAFREITALKSSGERIKMFNETRQALAIENHELAQWMQQTASQQPEHAAVIRDGWRPTGGAATGTSPQHVNAAATSSQSTPNQARPANSAAPGQLNSSPSSAKTTQQVQIKGKELLHTAGVFGGKANTAAKGLFAKGKSRLRGSDKVDSPPSRSTRDSPSPSPRGPKVSAQTTPSRSRTTLEQSNIYTPPLFATPSPRPHSFDASRHAVAIEKTEEALPQDVSPVESTVPKDIDTLSHKISLESIPISIEQTLPAQAYQPPPRGVATHTLPIDTNPDQDLRQNQGLESRLEPEPESELMVKENGAVHPKETGAIEESKDAAEVLETRLIASPSVVAKGNVFPASTGPSVSPITDAELPTRADTVSPLADESAQTAENIDTLSDLPPAMRRRASKEPSHKPLALSDGPPASALPQEGQPLNRDIGTGGPQYSRPLSFTRLPRTSEDEPPQDILPNQRPTTDRMPGPAIEADLYGPPSPTAHSNENRIREAFTSGATEGASKGHPVPQVPQQTQPVSMTPNQPSIFTMAQRGAPHPPVIGRSQPPPKSKYASDTSKRLSLDELGLEKTIPPQPAPSIPSKTQAPNGRELQSQNGTSQPNLARLSQDPGFQKGSGRKMEFPGSAVPAQRQDQPYPTGPIPGNGPPPRAQTFQVRTATPVITATNNADKGKKRSFFKNFGSRSTRQLPPHVDSSLGVSTAPMDPPIAPFGRQQNMAPPTGMQQRMEQPPQHLEQQSRGRMGSDGMFSRLNVPDETEERPPGSRESLVAHHGGSRTDLLGQPGSSRPDNSIKPGPQNSQPAKTLVKAGRRTSMPLTKMGLFSGSGSSANQPKAEDTAPPRPLSRSATSAIPENPKPRKSRFSGLGGIFGRSNASDYERRGSDVRSPAPNAAQVPPSGNRPPEMPPYLEAASRSSSQRTPFMPVDPSRPLSQSNRQHTPSPGPVFPSAGPMPPQRAQTARLNPPFVQSTPRDPGTHPLGGYYAPNNRENSSPSPSPPPLRSQQQHSAPQPSSAVPTSTRSPLLPRDHATQVFYPPPQAIPPPQDVSPSQSIPQQRQAYSPHPSAPHDTQTTYPPPQSVPSPQPPPPQHKPFTPPHSPDSYQALASAPALPRQLSHVAPAPPPAFSAPYVQPYPAPIQQYDSPPQVQPVSSPTAAPSPQYESQPIPAPYPRLAGPQPSMSITSPQPVAQAPYAIPPAAPSQSTPPPVQHTYPPTVQARTHSNASFPPPQAFSPPQDRSYSPIDPPLASTAPILPFIDPSSPLNLTSTHFFPPPTNPSPSSPLPPAPPSIPAEPAPASVPAPVPAPPPPSVHDTQQRPYPITLPSALNTTVSKTDPTAPQTISARAARAAAIEATPTSAVEPHNVRLPESPVMERGRAGDKEVGKEQTAAADDSDEEIVMSSTALPGQAWEPPGFASWDGL